MRVAVVMCALLTAASAVAFTEEECLDFDRFYGEAAVTTVLPPGGARLSARSGGAVRAGWYWTEFWALEGEAAWLEKGCGLSAKALWHWWGYERLDPFFTIGVKGWLPHGQVGPAGGLGAFWHLTESWSLRADADATLGVDTRTETVFSVAVGLRRSF
jgi:hypothetical protein